MKCKVTRALALLLTLALLAAGQGLATGTNQFSCGADVTASSGKEVLFPIYISGGANIAACRLYILCDTEVFSLKQTQSGDYQVQPGNVTAQGSWGANTYGNAGWQISWYREQNVKGEGVLCYLPLKVATNAPLGTYEVTLLCSAENTVDENGLEVHFTTANGSIEVVSAEPTIYTSAQNLMPGATVDLPVYLRNNPGLMGIHLQFESNDQVEVLLDNSGLPIVARGDLLSAGTFLVNAYGDHGGQLVWFNATPLEGDGMLCTVRLRIASTAEMPISVPLAYQPSNTLNSSNKPLSLLVEKPFDSSRSSPLAAHWDVNNQILRVSGKLDLLADLDQSETLTVLAFYRNGRLLYAKTNLGPTSDGYLSLEIPETPPANGDKERLSLYILDATTLAPRNGRTDIAIAN